MSNDATVELDLTGIAHGGEAIGRWQGKVVFVPYAIPGERVRVRIVDDKRKYARAELLEVLKPSADRVAPLCPHFGVCGGCQWQHIAYGRQMELRLEIVADQMQRLGHIAEPPIEGIVPAPYAWHYRNNVQLHPMPTPAPGDAAALPFGYVGAGGRDLIGIGACPLAHELVEEMIASLDASRVASPAEEGEADAGDSPWADVERLTLRAGINTGEQLVLVETGGEESPEVSVDLPISIAHLTGQGRLLTLVGSSAFHERLHDRTYRVMAPSFFQVNTAQAENLVEVVQQYCDLGGGERLLDLFCGVGTFSLPLSAMAGEVVGVESSPWAAADAEENGRDVPHFTIHEGDAAEVLPALDGHFDVAVVDPPRGGCGQAIVAQIERLQPQRLIYVSCDPATLARDTVYLSESNMRLERILAVDMFPQTAHVESVALFRRG
ncbi:MAG: 23S rRNA (uracil(1939)-C(5))-methyltransferase RlmD [Anaerolineae bacterium]